MRTINSQLPKATTMLRKKNTQRRNLVAHQDTGEEGALLSCPPPTPCVCENNPQHNETTTPLQLRFLVPVFDFLDYKNYFSQVAEDYTRLVGPSINIHLTSVSNFADLEREILFDVEQKTGQFDGYILNPILTGELVVNDGLWDLTQFIRNYQRNPNFWSDLLLVYRAILSSYNNKIFLFPFDGDVLSLYYRADLLEEHNLKVPKTWDEYNVVAEYFHGRQVEQMDPITGSLQNITLEGSCVGRVPNCAGAHWAQLVLATMTQYEGTSTGSLLDTRDLQPLLGPAMEETLRILEEQAKLGGVDDFDGCLEKAIQKMNHGECVLTYNWGNSFTQHLQSGSILRGKLGVAPTPGSPRVLDRATNTLVECDPVLCPYSERHVDSDGVEMYVNMAPYAAFSGWSGAVSNSVSKENKEAAADFLAFASDTGKALKFVIPKPDDPSFIPTGQDPYRKSMLDVDLWVGQGYPRETTEEYLSTIKEELDSKNVVTDIRFPLASALLGELDTQTYQYLVKTIVNPANGLDRVKLRKETTVSIHQEWTKLIEEADGLYPVSTLEIYQKSRGVFVPSEVTMSGGNGLSHGVIGTIVGVALAVGLVALAVGFCFVRRERKKHEDTWYLKPEDVVDTKHFLGKGSFGVVTKGSLRGTPVALKHARASGSKVGQNTDMYGSGDCFPDDTLADSELCSVGSPSQLLQKELSTLVQLRHPSIVQTMGATFKDGQMIIVLQYMENDTIRSLLRNRSVLDGTALMSLELQWALQVAGAMAFLHSYPAPKGPLLHNDLKSSNVLVDGSFNALVSDFGLVTKTMHGLGSWLHSSRNHSRPLRGSLLWMAPEVLNGSQPSPASDVYSYGMFLCELMTRSRPYGFKLADSQASSVVSSNISSFPQYIDERGNVQSLADDEVLSKDDSIDNDVGVLQDVSKDDEELKDVEIIVNTKDDNIPTKPRRIRRVSFSADSVSSFGTDGADFYDWRKELDVSNHRHSGSVVSHASRSSACRGTVEGKTYTREEILGRVKNQSLEPPFRPDLPESANQILRDLCVECWHKNPKRRPTMREIEERLMGATPNESVTKLLLRRGSVFDSILPPDVQVKLACGEPVPPVSYDEATIIFSDIVGFTSISSMLTAEEVGDLIARVMVQYDQLCKVFGVKKVDVIGDAFLGVAGVPTKVPDHASRAAEFALSAIEATRRTFVCPKQPHLGQVQVRFGIASGPVVATVIGSAEHPKYTLLGDTVNTASRMESSGVPNRCQCTEFTARLIREHSPEMILEARGSINIKGKGEMRTFIM